MKVVVVEDSHDMVTVLRLYAPDAVVFSDPLDALMSDDLDDADIILSDFHMPGMDGVTFLEACYRRNLKATLMLWTADPFVAAQHAERLRCIHAKAMTKGHGAIKLVLGAADG